jgi:hypothetical protein
MRVPRPATAAADGRGADPPGLRRYESAQSLATRLSTNLVELPGAHMAYLGQPHAFADALKPIVRGLA